jgi:hypothetical protein
MTARSWEQAVREQVALGRLLPLGDAADGAWLAERAAAGVLRRAAAAVRGARVTALRVEPAARKAAGAGGAAGVAGDSGEERGDAAAAESRAESVRDGGGAAPAGAEVRYLGERGRGGAYAGRRPAVGPPPVSALPLGELRITAECDAATDRPMTATAEALREALWRGAEERLGLRVAAVDIRVTGLLEAPQNAAQADAAHDTQIAAPDADADTPAARQPDRPYDGAPAGPAGSPRADALQVPGVLDLDVLEDGDHAEVRAVTDARHRALDVATAVRARIPAATVTVLITDIR